MINYSRCIICLNRICGQGRCLFNMYPWVTWCKCFKLRFGIKPFFCINAACFSKFICFYTTVKGNLCSTAYCQCFCQFNSFIKYYVGIIFYLYGRSRNLIIWMILSAYGYHAIIIKQWSCRLCISWRIFYSNICCCIFPFSDIYISTNSSWSHAVHIIYRTALDF